MGRGVGTVVLAACVRSSPANRGGRGESNHQIGVACIPAASMTSGASCAGPASPAGRASEPAGATALSKPVVTWIQRNCQGVPVTRTPSARPATSRPGTPARSVASASRFHGGATGVDRAFADAAEGAGVQADPAGRPGRAGCRDPIPGRRDAIQRSRRPPAQRPDGRLRRRVVPGGALRPRVEPGDQGLRPARHRARRPDVVERLRPGPAGPAPGRQSAADPGPCPAPGPRRSSDIRGRFRAFEGRAGGPLCRTTGETGRPFPGDPISVS